MTGSRSPKTQTAVEERYRRIRRELIGGGIVLGGLVLGGTLWYWLVEGWTWLEGAYMSVITLATVGFSEVRPLDESGRLFTIFLILMGIVVITYIANRFTEALIQGYFQAGFRLQQRRRFMDSLSNHYILCGFGRTGRQIALEFKAEKIPFVIVDSDEESIIAAQQLNYFTVMGDATEDQMLFKVGIDRAACLIAALPSDAENLYTVLSAKTLNPTLRTIARASSEEAVLKLQRGGADVVVSPYITGGKRMAAAALRPQVVDFVDGILTGSDRTFYMEEFLISPDVCPWVGQTLEKARLRPQSGALIIAIRRADGTLTVGPTAETMLQAGDVIIGMGTAEELRRLNRLLSPINPRLPRTPRR